MEERRAAAASARVRRRLPRASGLVWESRPGDGCRAAAAVTPDGSGERRCAVPSLSGAARALHDPDIYARVREFCSEMRDHMCDGSWPCLVC